MRRYLAGFSDAIVPDFIPEEEKINYILDWMGSGPSRMMAANPSQLSRRDPENTLNYKQLLAVCGTATNAFINLARSSDLEARRLLLLGPDNRVKHVVAEVLVDRRWVIVDPAFRVALKDGQGRLLTRRDLQNPAIFQQATQSIPHYRPEYDYDNFTHVRITRFPVVGQQLKHLLDANLPDWDERVDWTLLLERKSFFFLFISFCGMITFLLLRFVLAWYADNRIRVRRFRLRVQLQRAGSALFYTPEIK
ncbi:MAG: hypothetical protein NVS9B13_15700 [Candidatus Acidiferrum sp.]